MRIARLLTLCTAAAGALLPAALASPAAAATHVVTIEALKYSPAPPLRVGDKVVFINKDLFRHTVTASNGRFNLDLMPGARGALRINSAGKAVFYCKYHPAMRGVMVAR